jgi:hypothetical protein
MEAGERYDAIGAGHGAGRREDPRLARAIRAAAAETAAS